MSDGQDMEATREYVADLVTRQMGCEGFQLRPEQVGGGPGTPCLLLLGPCLGFRLCLQWVGAGCACANLCSESCLHARSFAFDM